MVDFERHEIELCPKEHYFGYLILIINKRGGLEEDRNRQIRVLGEKVLAEKFLGCPKIQ